MIEEAGKREKEAVKASLKLSDNPLAYVVNLGEQVKGLAKDQKKIVKNIYDGIIAKNSVASVSEESDVVKATMVKVPKKTYNGPTRGIRADDIEDEEDKKWFSANSRGTPLGRTSLELMNFVDGERSVYNIATAISLEYQNIDPLDVQRYLDIMKAAGKITYL